MPENSDLKLFISAAHGMLRTRPMAWLAVRGPDAFAFLQGQCTQDLRPLKEGELAPALWLNTKGRIQAESLVLRAADPDGNPLWWLWSAHSAGESLRSRLEEFIIADDVTVSAEESAWEQVSLAGPEAEAWLREAAPGAPPPAPGAWTRFGGGLLFHGRRGLPRSWEWLRPVSGTAPAASLSAASQVSLPALPELSLVALHRARLAAGVPAIPGEFGPQDLPQEAGLEESAVSFQKGCYLGQEVMARLHAMGQVRRRLLRVAGPGPAPAAPLELRQNDKRIGELRSTADDGRGGWIGLAMLNLLGLALATPLLTADQHAVHVLDPLHP
jgi:folate-binding protein YgfZ